jgi:hypothetical protein
MPVKIHAMLSQKEMLIFGSNVLSSILGKKNLLLK